MKNKNTDTRDKIVKIIDQVKKLKEQHFKRETHTIAFGVNKIVYDGEPSWFEEECEFFDFDAVDEFPADVKITGSADFKKLLSADAVRDLLYDKFFATRHEKLRDQLDKLADSYVDLLDSTFDSDILIPVLRDKKIDVDALIFGNNGNGILYSIDGENWVDEPGQLYPIKAGTKVMAHAGGTTRYLTVDRINVLFKE